ncbi:copper resistance protein NlpE [Vibrio sp. 99-8-1]|nr:copper resistance protein NlpE [Vibrio sp. 99-8-1]
MPHRHMDNTTRRHLKTSITYRDFYMNHFLVALLIGCSALVGCQANSDSTDASSTADNSRTSLDWPGMYKGMVPCDDCDGTNILLELNTDGSYMLGRSYIGKMGIMSMEQGAVVWGKNGNRITVGEMHYQVGENQLILLDQNGQKSVNQDGNSYLLRKE